MPYAALLLVADDKPSWALSNSVLPPPPRYPNGQLYTGMPGGALLETNNTLDHPTGPEYQLVVGEGTYVLRDDMHLATPPPHRWLVSSSVIGFAWSQKTRLCRQNGE